jgi:hypothetical protein
MLTVQYNGPALVVNHAVWYPGEMRRATVKQLADWRAEHGDVFVVPGETPADPPIEQGAADESTPKARRK